MKSTSIISAKKSDTNTIHVCYSVIVITCTMLVCARLHRFRDANTHTQTQRERERERERDAHTPYTLGTNDTSQGV